MTAPRACAWLAAAACLAAACSDRPAKPPAHYTVEKPARVPPPARPRRHALHEHAHGSHPHPASDHHHHPHPHPHLVGANGHHHPY